MMPGGIRQHIDPRETADDEVLLRVVIVEEPAARLAAAEPKIAFCRVPIILEQVPGLGQKRILEGLAEYRAEHCQKDGEEQHETDGDTKAQSPGEPEHADDR